jgi:hypothetical protein
MQVVCLILGSLSLMTVRKQRGVTTSLFDQRKLRRGSVEQSESEVEIEFSVVSSTTHNVETQPLLPIEIV